MRHFHLKKNSYYQPKVNVDKLWALAGAEALKNAPAQAKSGKALLLDITQHGVFKVLGKGRMPDIPIIVKARSVSKLAERKITEKGGKVILTA
jgi:large subunit ribosomal protein L27Ae